MDNAYPVPCVKGKRITHFRDKQTLVDVLTPSINCEKQAGYGVPLRQSLCMWKWDQAPIHNVALVFAQEQGKIT